MHYAIALPDPGTNYTGAPFSAFALYSVLDAWGSTTQDRIYWCWLRIRGRIPVNVHGLTGDYTPTDALCLLLADTSPPGAPALTFVRGDAIHYDIGYDDFLEPSLSQVCLTL